ncbi:MAG: hypothetical protein ABJ242_13090 [Marinomonas sp.]
MLFMFILLFSLVAVVGVAMFVSRTASHGEARFDSDTGKTKPDPGKVPPVDVMPAKRIADDNE